MLQRVVAQYIYELGTVNVSLKEANIIVKHILTPKGRCTHIPLMTTQNVWQTPSTNNNGVLRFHNQFSSYVLSIVLNF